MHHKKKKEETEKEINGRWARGLLREGPSRHIQLSGRLQTGGRGGGERREEQEHTE